MSAQPKPKTSDCPQDRNSQQCEASQGAALKMHDDAYGRAQSPVKSDVQLQPEAIKKAAQEIRDALERQNFWRDADTNKIENILLTLNEADRKALCVSYRNSTGKDLKADFESHLGKNAEYYKLVGLLETSDGKTDVPSHIAGALARLQQVSISENTDRASAPGNMGGSVSDLHTEQRRTAEKDLLSTIADLDAAGIKAAKQQYEAKYPGHNFEKDLTADEHISAETRQALSVLLKGSDQLNKNDVLKLADIGLNSRHLDIFLAAFNGHTPAVDAARVAFDANGGKHRIEQAFSGTDSKIALDYETHGHLSLRTLVDGNHHFWNTNKPGILDAVDHATDEERALYKRGEAVARSQQQQAEQLNGRSALSREDQEALSFYQSIHNTLNSSGSAKEVAVWEGHLLTHSAALIDGLANVSSKDRNALLERVENVSPNEWQSLKSHKEDLTRIDSLLGTFASDADRQAVMGVLRQKIEDKVTTFSQSQEIGKRSSDVVIANGNNDSDRINAILQMSGKDQDAYRTNAGGFRDRFNQQISSSLKDEDSKILAQHLLKKVQSSKQPTPDAVDLVLLATVRKDGEHCIDAVENAFKQDPSLRERLRHPNTDEDKALRRCFCDAINLAAMTGGYPCQSTTQEGSRDWFSKPLWQTGTLPLDMKLELHKRREDLQVEDILHADKTEQQVILNAKPGQVLEHGNGTVLQDAAKRQLVQNELRQNGPDLADRVRSFALAIDPSPQQVQFLLQRMNSSQREDLANKYFQKYGSLMSDDVLAKVPADQKSNFVELLSPNRTSAKQKVLDSREDANNHVGPLDRVMRDHWDYSKLQSEERLNDLSQFLTKHKSDIDNLNDSDKAAFDKAIADYRSAQKNYIDSKGKMADALADATITVAAIGGSLFTGGMSLELLAAVGAGGAAYRVAEMKTVEGSDFDASTKNILTQSFKGALSASLMFVAPGGGLLKVGEKVAPEVAELALKKLAEKGIVASSLRGSQAEAKQVLAREIANLSRQEATSGGRALEKELDIMVVSLLKDGASEAEKQAAKSLLRDEIKRATIKEVRSTFVKAAVHEGEAAAVAATTGAVTNVVSEVASTAVGLEDPNTLWDRVKGAAISGAGGALFFHCAFKAGTAGYSGVRALLGKDTEGIFAGAGTVIEHKDGTRQVVGEGKRYRFQAGDQIVEVELAGNAHPARQSEVGINVGGKNYTMWEGGQLEIGRKTQGDLAGNVGWEHGLLGMDAHGTYFIDHSRNGTFLTRGGKTQQLKPGEKTYLHPGDRIGLGRPVETGGSELALQFSADSIPQAPLSPVTSPLTTEAQKASNRYASRGDVQEPIPDGWQEAGKETGFDSQGRFNNGRSATVVDRANDPYLNQIIAQAHEKFAALPPQQRSTAMTQWVNQLLTPAGMTSQQIDNWYVNFDKAHAGQRILLGDYIRQHAGSCAQQALLLKVLGDSFSDMHPTLVRGTKDGVAHVWTTFDFGDGKARVFDPRNAIYGAEATQVPSYKAAFQPLQYGDLYAGDRISYNHINYKVLGYNGDQISLVADLPAIYNRQNIELRPGDRLQVGHTYAVKKQNGDLDYGWKLIEAYPDGRLRMVKADGSTSSLPITELNKAALVPGSRPTHAIVQRLPDQPDQEVYIVGNTKARLRESQGWWYGTPKSGSAEALGQVKVHVSVTSRSDLAKLQEVLIPALSSDPELQRLIPSWKTMDPLDAFNENTAAVGSGGQNTKGFTMYVANPADAIKVQRRLDQILAEKGLSLPNPLNDGNAATYAGRSNRVGLVRDRFTKATTTDNHLGAALDADLQHAINLQWQIPAGGRLSADQLHSVERFAKIKPDTLKYSADGRLVLECDPGDDKLGYDIYLNEAGADKRPYQMTDRPAIYALYQSYNLDPSVIAYYSQR